MPTVLPIGIPAGAGENCTGIVRLVAAATSLKPMVLTTARADGLFSTSKNRLTAAGLGALTTAQETWVGPNRLASGVAMRAMPFGDKFTDWLCSRLPLWSKKLTLSGLNKPDVSRKVSLVTYPPPLTM